jgi:uncharacterized protein (DUF433 family)
MTVRDRITIDAEVMQGKPVIRGTRIAVDLILRKLSEGATEADLLAAYPHLTVEDVRAALAYAADSVSHENSVVTSPDDILGLAARVYEGLSPKDIDEIEEMARRRTFFSDAHP